tara:strand:+ start:404 stop:670 length:267 start_codon:yes stop_codon:yes gene_type:complete
MTHKVKSYAWVANNWFDLDGYKFQIEIDGRKGLVTAEYERDVKAGTAVISFREYISENPVRLGEQEKIKINVNHKDALVTLIPEKAVA